MYHLAKSLYMYATSKEGKTTFPPPAKEMTLPLITGIG